MRFIYIYNTFDSSDLGVIHLVMDFRPHFNKLAKMIRPILHTSPPFNFNYLLNFKYIELNMQ